MHTRRLLIALLLAAVATAPPPSASAQDTATTVLRAAAMLDVESGEILRDAAVVIRDGRIVASGRAGTLELPAGAPVVDLGEMTMLPGLIDAHVHLTGDGQTHGYAALAISTTRSALIGAAMAKRTLEAGFTTVRNVGADGWADVALRDAIAAGEVPGPRLVVSGPALGITGGHCDNNLLPAEYAVTSEGVADGPWEVRRQVRENVKYGADLIKFCATGGVLSKGTTIGATQYTLEEMQALVDEAHTLGLRVAAHAHGTEGIKRAILAGVDSVEHASLLDEEAIALAGERGTALSMDIYVTEFILTSGAEAGILPESLDKERQVGQAQRASFSAAHEAGARIVFGTDAGVYPHGENARQLSRMVRFGMTPAEALRAATIHNAELLGLAGEVGSLRPGHHADVIAVPGDPLEEISVLERVAFVMKGGVVIRSADGSQRD